MSRLKIPMTLGNAVELAGIILMLYLLLQAPDVSDLNLRFMVYLVVWGGLLFFPHCLFHFMVGRLLGIRFQHYRITSSSISKLGSPILSKASSLIPILSLRVNQDSARSVSRGRRAVMYYSGAIASMVLPFFVVAAAFNHLPVPMGVLLLILSAANVAFDLYYSPKAGDISRARATS